MSTEKIEQLLNKYFEGKTSLEEEAELRTFFDREEVPKHLQAYGPIFEFLEIRGQEMSSEASDLDEDVLFARIDEKKKDNDNPSASHFSGLLSTRNSLAWTLRIAAGLVLLLTGFSAGLLVGGSGETGQQLASMQQEVNQIRNALVFGGFRQASASERIEAVRLSANIATSDDQVTQILIHTMNNDPNVNVRLAAVDALSRFAEEPGVRNALARSLAVQNDPFVQISLVELLVELKEQSAVNSMQKLLLDNETPEIVKQRIQEGIAILNT